jgi:outer membrane biosynthesis protein TonB
LLLTIILHLLTFIGIVTYKISKTESVPETYVEVSSAQPEKPKPQEKPDIDKKTEQEIQRQMQQQQGEARSNIAVNASDKLQKDISTEEYLRRLRTGYNFDMPGEKPKTNEKVNVDDNDKTTPATQVASQTKAKPGYKRGMTNIVYNLLNRKDLRLPVPVYMCEGSGSVTVNIEVNQQGRVVSASVDQKNSDASSCLADEALKSAKLSVFNADYQSAPLRQKGTITYSFIAQ